VHHVANHDRDNDDDNDGKNRPDAQINQGCFLSPLDGGDDGCATFGTRPRMVADLRAAFVTLNKGHKPRLNSPKFSFEYTAHNIFNVGFKC
jgi:hypothetical protein